MTEILVEQSVEAIKHGDPIEALEILDDETDSAKVTMARTALKEEAFTDETLRDFIRKRSKEPRPLPRSTDDDVNRIIIRESVARKHRKYVV